MSLDAPSAVPRNLATRLASAIRGPVGWKMARWSGLLDKIEAHGRRYADLADDQLRKESLSLRYRVKTGEPPARLLPEAYALVREAATRTIGQRHFDVQILGGIALFYGSIAEMQTGEGKTLTATLPLYLRGLEGKGAHLATVNDYLAERDADWMRPAYELLGLSVGVIQTPQGPGERRPAYACDITYGTAKEFGFDFLRDRLLLRASGRSPSDPLSAVTAGGGAATVCRAPHFALIDEADSILIDEARTPLIIGTFDEREKQVKEACFGWAARHAGEFEEYDDYYYDHEKRQVDLTKSGRRKARSLPQQDLLHGVKLLDLYRYIERAIKVGRDFHRDRHFVIRDGEVVIVDESTGRIAEGRKWRDGIHQAIEAKEGVEITTATGQAARVTVQELFRRYPHLAGMSGTASNSAREFRRVYQLAVVPVPTNRPPRRKRLAELVLPDAQDKWRAIVEEIKQYHAESRPVLVGTRSIDRSEELSAALIEAGIEHQVLNARNVAEEAEIVARAGERDRVTVATNMAGRGTDIKLGQDVADLGGLHVICTELHESSRIDRQLIGRCGRQGDPGSYRQYLSLDDDILREAFGPDKAASLRASLAKRVTADAGSAVALFRRAQQRVEREHLRQRTILLHHERERTKMQREMGQDPYLDSPE